MQDLKALLRARAREAGQQVADAMHMIDGENESDVTLSEDILEGKTVVKVLNSVGSIFRVVPNPNRRKLTKLFFNGCAGCVLNLDDSILTQHIELIHCEDMTVNVNAKLYTLQLDLCKNVKVNYGDEIFCEDSKLIHAGVENLEVSTNEGYKATADYSDLTSLEIHNIEADAELSPEERQFMTKLEEGRMITVRVIKRDGHIIPSSV